MNRNHVASPPTAAAVVEFAAGPPPRPAGGGSFLGPADADQAPRTVEQDRHVGDVARHRGECWASAGPAICHSESHFGLDLCRLPVSWASRRTRSTELRLLRVWVGRDFCDELVEDRLPERIEVLGDYDEGPRAANHIVSVVIFETTRRIGMFEAK